MKRSIVFTRQALQRLFMQRCFYLFTLLLALMAAAPFIDVSPRGILIRNAANIFIILALVAAVGRSMLSFVIVLLLAAPCLLLRWLSIVHEETQFFELSLQFNAGLYVAAIAYLLRYVFDRNVMDADRLWGAAATYLMLGILWGFVYAIVDRANANAFLILGSPAPLDFTETLYFSFATLTTTGFGDIVPASRVARMAAVIEGVAGQLFLAILIAKLVGVYPSLSRQVASPS